MNEALLETFLADFSLSIEHPEEGDNSLFELIARDEKDPPLTYRLTEQ